MGLLIPFVLLPYLVLFVLLLAWYDGEDSHDVCTELDFPLDNPLTLITYKVTIKYDTVIVTYSAYESVDTLIVTITGPRGIVSSVIKMLKMFY